MPANGETFVKDEQTGFLTPKQHGSNITFGSESKKRWLEIFQETGNKGKACDSIGISYSTYLDHCKLDEAFSRAVKIALLKMHDNLESSFYKKGLESNNGFMFGMAWLRKNFPELWNPKTQITVNNQGETVNQLWSELTDLKRADGSLIDIPESHSVDTSVDNSLETSS